MAHATLTNLFPHNFLAESDVHKSLGEEFSLCDSGNMTFHWADFNETCDTVQAHIHSDPKLREDFKRREESLTKLNLIPVWVKSGRKVYHKTMFELYERHILSLHHQMGGVDPYETIEISFISGTGPFKSMSIAECFNKITYQDFVLVYLIRGKLPKRNFRLRLKAKILVEFGENFSDARLINLEQMTSNGLLLSMDSTFFRKELSQAKSMRLLLDTEVLREANGMPVEKLKSHLSLHTFNLMYSSRKEDAIEVALETSSSQSSFDHYKNKKVYVFVTYDALAKGSPKGAMILRSFVDYTRDLVRDHYRVITERLKSA